MGIKEEIKQSQFRNAYQKAFINILYTNNWLEEQVRGLLKDEDLTKQQFNVLRILRGSHPEPLSTLQIRERMLDKMSDTSRIVDRLVKKDFVHKQTCPSDKRLVDVMISEGGLKKLEAIDAKEHVIEDSLQNLNPEEAELLSDLLDKLRKTT
ncbi:MAG: MarR family winged helix-turn-helix transcriptional regulator [Croceimicrobium sp.]|nr:MarR family transcriptional regulator [Bacteroidota bacterium]